MRFHENEYFNPVPLGLLKRRSSEKNAGAMPMKRPVFLARGTALLGALLCAFLPLFSRQALTEEARAMGAIGAKYDSQPQRLDSYTIKGMTFTYYLIPSGLDREELIAAAQALHHREPKAQLILVDDTKQLKDYINYAKEFSRGNLDAYFPMEWAKQHVIANVQKFISGKYKLCRGMGVDEIADLK